LTVVFVQLIEQFPAARIGKRLEHLVHCRQYMQPNGCMSSTRKKFLIFKMLVLCGENLQRNETRSKVVNDR
jgi:hypothetical protein